MGATLDADTVVVNLSSSPGAVARKSFGTPNHATDGASFAERLRFYETNTAAQADADLDAATKLAAAQFFAQEPRPPKLAISRVAYASLAVDLDAVRAENDDWYGLDIASRVQADIENAASWTETNQKLFIAQSSDASYLDGTGGNVGEVLRLASYQRSAGPLYHSADLDHAALVWLTTKLWVDPDVRTTFWKAATLVSILPDDITDTEKANVFTENGNVFLTLGGLPATGEGTLAGGGFIDERITRDWFKARLEENTAQLIIDVSAQGRKIPYDDTGIAMIENLVRELIVIGEAAGHFLVGSSTVTVPLRQDVSDADVLARELNLSVEVTLAGAIQKVIYFTVVLTA